MAGPAYHVVGTFDGATQRLYLNGVQVATRAHGRATALRADLDIGSWDGGSEFFTGAIDEVALYN